MEHEEFRRGCRSFMRLGYDMMETLQGGTFRASDYGRRMERLAAFTDALAVSEDEMQREAGSLITNIMATIPNVDADVDAVERIVEQARRFKTLYGLEVEGNGI
ncbi:hypothetical protein J2T17_004693 [Paenibacillus mucilaginosus]|uniref:hypothetical protein n=1 Tax=Paenibacillus mucilaginosus TaxID=61624 RepID=UPI003D190CE8